MLAFNKDKVHIIVRLPYFYLRECLYGCVHCYSPQTFYVTHPEISWAMAMKTLTRLLPKLVFLRATVHHHQRQMQKRIPVKARGERFRQWWGIQEQTFRTVNAAVVVYNPMAGAPTTREKTGKCNGSWFRAFFTAHHYQQTVDGRRVVCGRGKGGLWESDVFRGHDGANPLCVTSEITAGFQVLRRQQICSTRSVVWTGVDVFHRLFHF